MFENDIRVDLPDVLGVESDGANSPLPRFVTKARCPLSRTPPESQWSRFVVETGGVLKHNIPYSYFSFTFSFLFAFVSF